MLLAGRFFDAGMVLTPLLDDFTNAVHEGYDFVSPTPHIHTFHGVGCMHCQLAGRKLLRETPSAATVDKCAPDTTSTAPVMESCWLGMYLSNLVQQAFQTSALEEGSFVLEGFAQ